MENMGKRVASGFLCELERVLLRMQIVRQLLVCFFGLKLRSQMEKALAAFLLHRLTP